MLTAIRHALVGFNREEQEEFLVRQIYRLSRWVEQSAQAAHAGRAATSQPGAPDGGLVAELNAELAAADRAKAHISGGLAMPRAEFASMRRRIAHLERVMDVA